MPLGTGTLYVPVEKHPDRLQRENRLKNVTDTQEGKVVQFLALGGHTRFTGLGGEPTRVFSGVHAGPGQQVFGFSDKQRADALLFFEGSRGRYPAELHYHNFHGEHWHYEGHLETICSKTDFFPAHIFKDTLEKDSFRRAYAEAMTSVFPLNVKFHYSTSFSCHFFHGGVVEKLGDEKTYFDLSELLYTHPKYKDKVFVPTGENILSKSDIKARIKDGSLTGFVTVKGGREVANTQGSGGEKSAASKFGFCVQNYAPKVSELSETTRRQISEYYGFTSDEQVKKYVESLQPRTLNSTTFHAEETVSTSYLRWLMLERNFDHFEITHFLRYTFTDDSRAFLEPLLQKRHQYKREGNKTAAECIKLILNGGFG